MEQVIEVGERIRLKSVIQKLYEILDHGTTSDLMLGLYGAGRVEPILIVRSSLLLGSFPVALP